MSHSKQCLTQNVSIKCLILQTSHPKCLIKCLTQNVSIKCLTQNVSKMTSQNVLKCLT